MSEAFRLEQVAHWFGSRRVLHVPELTIQSGETLGVIGPSGAGKTTLLRILAMLEHPAAGTVCYFGTQLNGDSLAVRRRETTLVFQRPALLDQTVYENVAFGLKIRGIEERSRVEQTLEQLGIDHLRDQHAFSLSAGVLQRTAVARALVIQPRVLLLDEPTANLDPANVEILENTISKVALEGTTVVLVSHNLHQVRRLTNRVAGIMDGELIECGPVEEIVTSARSPRLRAFISGGIGY